MKNKGAERPLSLAQKKVEKDTLAQGEVKESVERDKAVSSRRDRTWERLSR